MIAAEKAQRGGEAGPLVTVVMPCYNHERYVARAVESVLAQTYPHIQLVVIDDGSRDGSVALLAELRDRKGFELICQENRGVCQTLNRAIREGARGEWIALLASDDFWHPEKIAKQIEALAGSGDAQLCFSQAVEFSDEAGIERGRVFPARLLQGRVLNQVFVRQHVPAGTMLFSRKLYDELGGFDERLKEEDWDFVIRAASRTPFVGVTAPLLFYRQHQGNTMRTRKRRAIFHQKALILSKNFELVSPGRWLFAVLLHFTHDIGLGWLRSLTRRE